MDTFEHTDISLTDHLYKAHRHCRLCNQTFQCRNNERQHSPDELGPKYVDQFLEYFDSNPSLNIIVFGLNCSEPEDMMRSFECIFSKTKHEENGNQVQYYI